MPTPLTCPSCRHAFLWLDGAAPPPDCPACHRPLPPEVVSERTHSQALAENLVTGPYVNQPTQPGGPALGAAPPSAEARSSQALVGQIIAGYEVLEELGRGGMGVVYKARQVALHRTVALKMIRSPSLASDEARARFRAEALAAARLQHPNIVTVHEIGEWEGEPYFSQELVGGGNLGQALGTNPQPAADSAALVEALARAMHYAHGRGVVHRDLKPGNVLVPVAEGVSQAGRDTHGSRPGVTRDASTGSTPSSPSASGHSLLHWAKAVKITDFGLAKQLEDEGPGQTQTGQVMGTPSYMAPEQARGEKDIGPAADIYALGALLYQCLTGRPPFKGATSRETIEQVLHAEPVAPGRLVPNLPADLNTICLKCLEKEPARRYASAGDLADDLRRFLDGEPIKARPVGALGRATKWARRQPMQAALLGLIVALVLGFSALVTAQWQRAERAADRAREEAERAGREKQAADTASALAETRRVLAVKETDRANHAAADAKRQEGKTAAALELAKKERGRAEAALGTAREQEKKAIAARKREELLRELADLRRDTAELAEVRARRALSISRIGQAQAAFTEGNLKLAADLLDTVAPEARSWDWHLMRRLTSGGAVSLSGVGRVYAFSLDGRYVAGLSDGQLLLLDLHDQAKRTRLVGHGKEVTSLAFTPDSKVLLSASRDGTVRLWSVTTGKEEAKFTGHTGAVLAVAISPDGKRAASAGDKVRLWSLATRREEKALGDSFTRANALAFSPDGKLLAWGGESTPRGGGGAKGGLRAWDVASGKELASLAPYHHWGVGSLAFHPEDGRLAFSSSFSFRVIDPRSGKDAGPKLEKPSSGAVVVSPDGRFWATEGQGAVHLTDTVTGKVIRSVPARQVAGHRIGFTPDARFLTISRAFDDGDEERIDCWPTRGSAEGLHLRHGLHSPLGMAFSPDSRRLLTAGVGDGVLWDTRTGTVLRTVEGAAHAAAWSADGRWIATGAPFRKGEKGPVVVLWRADKFEPAHRLEGSVAELASLAFSRDNRFLAAGSGSLKEGRLTVWEVATGKQRWSVPVGTGSISKLAWSPEGNFLVTAGVLDRFLRYTDAATGKLLQRLEPHTGGVGAVAYSPNGAWLATGGSPQFASRTGEVKIFDRLLGRELRVLRGHNNMVWGLGWGPGGDRLASAGVDNTIKIWDPANGLEALTLRAPGLNVTALAFSPDGHFLAARGFQSIYLYDGRPVRERVFLKEQARSSNWTAFGADGRWALHKDEIGTLVARHPQTGRLLWSLEVKERLEPLYATHVDLGRVAAADGKNVVERDAATGTVTRTYTGPAATVWKLFYSTDGKSLAAVSGGVTADRKPASVQVHVWDTASGKQRHRFVGPADLGRGLAVLVSSDLGRVGLLVPGPVEKEGRPRPRYRFWDLATGKEQDPVGEVEGAREVSWRREGRRASPARLGRGTFRGDDEITRVIDVPADEGALAAARLLPQPHWHIAEAGAAQREGRWHQAVHHLERARVGIQGEQAQREADYLLAGMLHNLATARRREGHHPLAIVAFRRSLAISTPLVRAHPKEVNYFRDQANTQVELGRSLTDDGQLDEAEKLIREGNKGYEAAAKAQPENAGYKVDILYGHLTLASLLHTRKRPDEAEKALRQAVERGRGWVKDHPNFFGLEYHLSAACHNLANQLTLKEEHAKAIPFYREAREALARIATPFSNFHVQQDHGNTLVELGRALMLEDQWDEGRRVAEDGLDRLRKLADRPGAPPHVRLHCAQTLDRYALVLKRRPRPTEVEAIFEEALRRGREELRLFPDDHRIQGSVSAIWHNLGHFYFHHGQRPHAAEHALRQAETLLKKVNEDYAHFAWYRRDLANTRLYLGLVLASLGKRLPAQTQLRLSAKEWEALAREHKSEPEYPLSAAHARAELALLRGKPVDAAREAEAMVQSKAKRERQPYTAACVLARCAALTAKDAAQPAKERDAAVERYASRAVVLLAEALRLQLERPDYAQTDPDLAALRARGDYKKLFAAKQP